jgi:pterin-4a-carbinolamine dehydratase
MQKTTAFGIEWTYRPRFANAGTYRGWQINIRYAVDAAADVNVFRWNEFLLSQALVGRRFHRAEDVFHHPQLLVLQRHLARRSVFVVSTHLPS